jgi:molybdopterin-guanine dinucleotide biosynthesis protein A
MAMRPLSAVVLAGGGGQRMGGSKALLEIDGQPLVIWVLERLQRLSDDLILVARDTSAFGHLPVRLVSDIYPGEGPLVGLHAGLQAARHPAALAVACDMPFLDLRLLRYMIVVGKAHDAVVPRLASLPEPLHAIYRVDPCLRAIQDALDAGSRKMTSFLESVEVRYVEENEIALFDPDQLSFFNVNTPEDLQRGEALAYRQRGGQASASWQRS